MAIRSFWKVYLALSLTVTGAFFLIPLASWASPLATLGVGWTAAIVMVVGIRRNKLAFPWPWYLFAAGMFVNASGRLVQAILSRVLNQVASPSLADVFWLFLYPAFMAGMAMVIRRRSMRGDWAPLVDAATVSTGLGLLCWVFLIHPAAVSDTVNQLSYVVAIAYPVGDVVMLATLVRLLIGGGDRSMSFVLMAGSVVVALVGDISWAISVQIGWTPSTVGEHLLDMVYLVAYTLFGAAGLHPSVREVEERRSTSAIGRLSPWLLGLLTGASLIAPCVLLIEVYQGQVHDGVAIAVSSTALFLLVVTRMAQLLKQVETQARNLRDLARVDELTGLPNRRAWGSDIAAAIDRARRERVPLSVAMIDLDHFKRFNDEFGHPAGDRLLKGAAAAWRGGRGGRGPDCALRRGGVHPAL